MPKFRTNKSGKEDRFTYRTSVERGRKLRQRALDIGEYVEDVLDMAVDRYFKDPKTGSLDLPKNLREVRYSQKLLALLRDKHVPEGHMETLDFLLDKY